MTSYQQQSEIMAAKHTYTKGAPGSSSAKAIFVDAEFDANKLTINDDKTGMYVTFNNNTIGHVALKDMGLDETGENFFRKGMLHKKFTKTFRVKVINTNSSVKLIGTGKQMYDLQVIA